MSGKVPLLLLGVAPVWLTWFGGDVCVSSFGVGVYTGARCVSNETVKVIALTTYTDMRAVSIEEEVTRLIVEEATGLITLVADLELLVHIRYNTEKTKTLITIYWP